MEVVDMCMLSNSHQGIFKKKHDNLSVLCTELIFLSGFV
jgi:hypothetical protein